MNLSRRQWLARTSTGFGSLALAALCADQSRAASESDNPLSPRAAHFPARAQRVIFLFMTGGPSHVDTFDYKPELQRRHNQEIEGTKGIQTQTLKGKVFGSPFRWAQHGESGLWISDQFPHLARHADDLCVIKSLHCNSAVHEQAAIQMHTGIFQQVRPSLGSWVLYGLGTESRNLPGFITINPPGIARSKDHGSAFLPAVFQGTRLSGAQRAGESPIRFIANPEVPRDLQRAQLDLLGRMNRGLGERIENETRIDGLIESFELAFRMQAAVPELLDVTRESADTLRLYGLDAKGNGKNAFAKQCLFARRFAEAGVRFIQLSLGDWDNHQQIATNLPRLAEQVDQPIAGLLTDLKRRGMLDDTLVVWGGEFGRTPISVNGHGRDHNGAGFSYWLAGGGVRGGMSYGSTDELGWAAAENKVHVHDLHATILHLLGLDHERLTFHYGGRDYRLTDVGGNVVREIVA